MAARVVKKKLSRNVKPVEFGRVKQFSENLVPRAGFEPARAEAQRILSPSRLPFRHLGAF